ncbi:MAG: hypothetical protein JWM88_1478 [Verrucomicrobia bacterium]|nr:hypothetical protein [Verrucomicrobiota bacterium]
MLAVVLLASRLHAADPLAARVVILANSADPDSVRIARHYAEVRGVPVTNVISLAMPAVETLSWAEFVSTIWRPLETALIRGQWIDAIPMTTTDDAGRAKAAINGHRIAYLVVCRGVPLRISHDPSLYRPKPPITDNPIFRTNAAAVDSELSLLAVNESPINAFLANPLFRNDHPSAADLSRVIKVSRLDGPTADDAFVLVDRAVEAEKTGLIGRAYVDVGGVHPDGDTWLRSTAAQLREMDFDVDVDEAPATMPSTARSDAPAFYFGWYASRLNGPFALPGFRFPPGAIAIHIHSESATTLRSAEAGWSGPLVARGVTATVGNVFEPYLQLLHRPDLLLYSLARGDRFGDAACYSLPALSWQAIAIGDPLYRPFAVPLPEQVRNRAALPRRAAGYVTLREIRRLDSLRRSAEALALGEAAQAARPTLAVGCELARRGVQAGNFPAAARALRFAAALETFPPDEWALAHEAARLLRQAGAPDDGAKLLRHLLRDPALPAALRALWLADARDAAAAAGQVDQAAAWAAELEALRNQEKN